MADHEQALKTLIDPVTTLEVFKGPRRDEDPDDVVRIIEDGGFTPQLEYGQVENRNDEVQVLVRHRDYETGRDVKETIRQTLSPSIPTGYISVTLNQAFTHFQQDDDDRHYWSARFLCKLNDPTN